MSGGHRREGTAKRVGGQKVDDLGLEWMDYGARWYDPAIARWGQVDPLAGEYFTLSPFSYVANNPINAIDPDGERIIFVNGLLGFGSPEGGPTYWNGARSTFVTGAKRYLGDDDVYFTDINHGRTSSAQGRINAGKKWARENYESLIQGLDKDKDDFKFVSHSMGSAFAEGAIRYLKRKGWNVTQAIHLEAFQADGFEAHTDPPFYGTSYNTTIGTFTVDYQLTNDWVINDLPVASNPGDIAGASVKIRVRGTNDYDTRHREPIDSGEFWDLLSGLISEALQRDANTRIEIDDNE